MAQKILPPTGMKDTLPVSARRKQDIMQILTSVYTKWGFLPIETPAMEKIDRLIGSDGGDNEKLVFQVLRRGLDEDKYKAAIESPNKLVDLGLRYDLTVPMSRFYASNHGQLPAVCKFLQYGPVWRAERPQKGRFRQFMQWDADIVGATEGLPEVQLLLCSSEALQGLGLHGFTIRFNDRRVLKALVDTVGIDSARHDEAFIVIDKLDKVGIEGVAKEMSERGFEATSISLLTEKLAPFLGGGATSIELGLEQLGIDLDGELSGSMKLVFDEVKNKAENFSIVFDPTLVRGMGYYTGQIFEVEYGDYPFSIAGGGRYDGMIGRFLGKDTPACGFSLGFDRILTILDDKGVWPTLNESKKLALLIQQSDLSEAITQAEKLRSEGYDVSIEIKAKNIKRQLEGFKSLGFSHFSMFDSSKAIEMKSI